MPEKGVVPVLRCDSLVFTAGAKASGGSGTESGHPGAEREKCGPKVSFFVLRRFPRHGPLVDPRDARAELAVRRQTMAEATSQELERRVVTLEQVPIALGICPQRVCLCVCVCRKQSNSQPTCTSSKSPSTSSKTNSPVVFPRITRRTYNAVSPCLRRESQSWYHGGWGLWADSVSEI